MTSEQLSELSELAVQAALAAGKLINSYRQKTYKISTKARGGSLASEIVTEVDIKAQEIIEEILYVPCQKYDLALLGEETLDDNKRFSKDFFWSVDPLDGTLPFCENIEGFSVSIALVSWAGIPHIGVIYDPFNDKLYTAIKGKGAWINHLPWQPTVEQSTLSCVFDRSFMQDSSYKSFLQKLNELARSMGYDKTKLLIPGGAALNACWVLEQAPGIYIKLPKEKGGSVWDYAASTCIYNERSALAHDIYGNPFELNRRESTYMCHNGILFATSKELSNRIQTFLQSFDRSVNN